MPYLEAHAFQLRHVPKSVFQPVHHAFLRIHPGNSLLDDPISIDDQVSGKSVYRERTDHAVVGIPILRPIHILFGDKLAPRLLILVGADADKNDFGIRVFSSQVLQFRNRSTAGRAPGRPEIKNGNVAS